MSAGDEGEKIIPDVYLEPIRKELLQSTFFWGEMDFPIYKGTRRQRLRRKIANGREALALKIDPSLERREL